ncbi:MAG: S1/P1 Nuclease [Cyclobacteriaceae bacterium]|nr:S1/P1 Nuclease [Cyclobacteriaceae bacterium]
MRKLLPLCLTIPCLGFVWGFFAHKKINRLAVFTLPSEMIGFYKKNIEFLTEESVSPDRRRYAVKDEAPRHYIDLDDFGDSAIFKLPRTWQKAVERYGEDSLMEKGIVPWHVTRMYYQLKTAMLLYDPQKILWASAELGHYVADANVPLHTTSNYDGQLTNQVGLHGFWESRLPELFFNDYDFFVGKASYIGNVPDYAWQAVTNAHLALDSVLYLEKHVGEKLKNKKYSFETRGKQTVKVVSYQYAKAYHSALDGMVERQMRASVKMIGDLWYTAWVDAGQPDLKKLIDYKPSTQELETREKELELWKGRNYPARKHEEDGNN